MEDCLTLSRRHFAIGAVALRAAAVAPVADGSARAVEIHKVESAVRNLVRHDRSFELQALGFTWKGMPFDMGFQHGVAISTPARRHAVKVPHRLVTVYGPMVAAKSAVLELLTWAAA